MWTFALACIGAPAVVVVALYATRSRWMARLGALPPPRYGVRVRRNLPVPMADGAVLLADLYAPRAAGRFPTILIRSPWGRGWERPPFSLVYAYTAGRFAERGFQVLVQSVRERPAETAQHPANEAADGRATLAWIGAQPWFDGRLGWWGASYLGHVIWAAAPDAPPFLRAIMPITTSSRWRSFFYEGRLLALDRLLTVGFVTSLAGLPPLRAIAAAGRQRQAVAAAAHHLPVGAADVPLLGAPSPALRELLRHPDSADPYWRPVDHSERVGQVRAAAYLVAGWHDFFLRDALADYARLRAAGARPYLTIGPWSHVDQELSGFALREGLAWFDQALGQRPAPADDRPVRLLIMGVNEWRALPDWPPPAGERTFFLHPGGRLDPAPPVGPRDAASFRYDPADPPPALGGQLMTGSPGSVDNAPLEARSDVLSYTTAPLEADLEVIGEVRAELFCAFSAAQADIVARLCAVGADGVARNICDGAVRVANASAGTPGDGALLAQIALGPTAYRFQKGERVRLLVMGALHPRWARNLGVAEPDATATPAGVVEQTIFQNGDWPSALVLPVQ